MFKFRSTPTGALPTDADLLRTIAEGIRWAGMVGRPDLPEGDRRALVAFLETLVPPDRRVPASAALGEERAGWMLLLRHGGGRH